MIVVTLNPELTFYANYTPDISRYSLLVRVENRFDSRGLLVIGFYQFIRNSLEEDYNNKNERKKVKKNERKNPALESFICLKKTELYLKFEKQNLFWWKSKFD